MKATLKEIKEIVSFTPDFLNGVDITSLDAYVPIGYYNVKNQNFQYNFQFFLQNIIVIF